MPNVMEAPETLQKEQRERYQKDAQAMPALPPRPQRGLARTLARLFALVTSPTGQRPRRYQGSVPSHRQPEMPIDILARRDPALYILAFYS